MIFGCTRGNDVSVRDWQLRTQQFTPGQVFDYRVIRTVSRSNILPMAIC